MHCLWCGAQPPLWFLCLWCLAWYNPWQGCQWHNFPMIRRSGEETLSDVVDTPSWHWRALNLFFTGIGFVSADGLLLVVFLGCMNGWLSFGEYDACCWHLKENSLSDRVSTLSWVDSRLFSNCSFRLRVFSSCTSVWFRSICVVIFAFLSLSACAWELL
jgi:hypothetical protein